MALLFMDGFDYYTTAELGARGWSGASNSMIATASTRFNYGQAINPNGNGANGIYRAVPNSAVLFFGFAIYWTDLPTSRIVCQFQDVGTTQVDLRTNASGQFYFTRNGTVIGGTSTAGLQTGTWNYYEVSVTFATGTAGSATLKINGVTALTVTGVNTSATGDAYANRVTFGLSNAWDFYVDDVYCCDNTTSQNNTFLGDVRVYALLPSGAGASTQWTPNGATSNYQCVNTSPAATTKYVSSATPGQIDLYTLPTISAANAIDAVQIDYYAEKDDSGTRIIESVVQSGSTQATGAQNALGTSYGFFSDIFPNDPNTSAPWTLAAINALQVGVEEVE
jgi:hypothetical protein